MEKALKVNKTLLHLDGHEGRMVAAVAKQLSENQVFLPDLCTRLTPAYSPLGAAMPFYA